LDICARWHGDAGDEFILVLLDVNLRDAIKVVRRIQKVFPRFSWGITQSGLDDSDTLESMIDLAETRMYRQKNKKK